MITFNDADNRILKSESFLKVRVDPHVVLDLFDYVYSLITILVANRYFRQNAAFASVFSRDASAVA